jgi:Bacterial protein of unknown function (DUF882)
MPFSGFQDLDPDFARRLQAYFAANPGLSSYSGYRTPQRQAQLFAASDQTGHTVARHSLHTDRLAADLALNGVRLDRLPAAQQQALQHSAGQYGLKFPMSWEAWHVEPFSTRGGRMAGGGSLPDYVSGSSAASVGETTPSPTGPAPSLGVLMADAVGSPDVGSPEVSGGSILPKSSQSQGLLDLSQSREGVPLDLQFQRATLTPEELLQLRKGQGQGGLADVLARV